MKLWNYLPLIFLSILIFTSCESLMPGKDKLDNDTTALEQDALMDDLSQDLNLSSSMEKDFRGKLEESRTLHAHPASLWRLAVALYNKLTDGQLDKLLNHEGQGDYDDHAFNAKYDEKPHSSRYFDYIVKCLNDIIDESQKAELNAMIEEHNNHKSDLGTAWKNDEFTLETFKAEIFALKNHMKLSIEKNLTDEQLSAFEAKIDELKQIKFDESEENQKADLMKQEMYLALEMTDEQIEQLEKLQNEFKYSIEIINQEFLEGSIDDSALMDIVSGLFITMHESKQAVLTEKQQTIILIHHILTTRAHGKYSYWKKR